MRVADIFKEHNVARDVVAGRVLRRSSTCDRQKGGNHDCGEFTTAHRRTVGPPLAAAGPPLKQRRADVGARLSAVAFGRRELGEVATTRAILLKRGRQDAGLPSLREY